MKRVLILLSLFVFPVVSMGEMYDEMKIQMLNQQIEELTHERDSKYEQLKQCEKTTKGFKIAGISTLVATGIGIYGNVKLYQKLNGISGGGVKKSVAVVDNRSPEEKSASNHDVICSEPEIARAMEYPC